VAKEAQEQVALRPGVRESASLAMLDPIDFAEELGMMQDDEAERHRAAVRDAFGDVDGR